MTTKTATLSRVSKTCEIEKLVMQFDEGRDLFVTICDDKTEIRTRAMNALMHCYYRDISDFIGDEIEDVSARCKRKFGLPIMRIQAAEITKKGNKVYFELLRFGLIKTESPPELKRILINYYDLDEVGQIECFKLIAVTRNFNNKEMRDYIEKLERYFAGQGLVLESKNEKLRREAGLYD